MDKATATKLVAALMGGNAAKRTSRRSTSGGAPKGRSTAKGKGKGKGRYGKKYSGCSVKSSYVLKSRGQEGVQVNHPCYSIWMKLRGEQLITMVGVPHTEGYIVKSKEKGNEWHKYCFTVRQGIDTKLTTGFVNPRTQTVHLPYLGIGYIASPKFGKKPGGACFHPTGKKK